MSLTWRGAFHAHIHYDEHGDPCRLCVTQADARVRIGRWLVDSPPPVVGVELAGELLTVHPTDRPRVIYRLGPLDVSGQWHPAELVEAGRLGCTRPVDELDP